ncbi:lysozyme [uncultured Caudovirales phage]|uniref:Lysozyme n=1 Tax=uncultured Caudovirales phage TaxID=2100421 RepID=A0A6J5LW87_9CAUD|nr:lysozyme [uncultured Caudovirales phage]
MAYKANTKKREKTDFIAIHCSATANQNFGAADIDKWHRKNGWACIGYHYVIRRDGTVEEGREESVIGAHVADWNAVSLGICMVGGVDADDRTKAKNNFTKEQFASLKELLVDLKIRYPKAKIQGHRDFPNVKKACPSFDVAEWLKVAQLDN